MPYAFLFCIEANALADVVVAGGTEDVEGHFEADDEDALVELAGAAAEGVRAGHFVDVGLAIVVGWIVLVERLHRRGTDSAARRRCRTLQRSGRRSDFCMHFNLGCMNDHLRIGLR